VSHHLSKAPGRSEIARVGESNVGGKRARREKRTRPLQLDLLRVRDKGKEEGVTTLKEMHDAVGIQSKKSHTSNATRWRGGEEGEA